jgi:hypothetical protein
VYQAAYDLSECLEAEVEQSDCNAAERRDQQQYETDGEARLLFARQESGRIPRKFGARRACE